MKKLKSILILIFTSFLCNTASALTFCNYNTQYININFGTVMGLTVGKTQTTLSVTCSAGGPFSITIGDFPVNFGNVVSTYTDSSYKNLLTSQSSISAVGTGVKQDFPLYFKLHATPGGLVINGENVINTSISTGYSGSATITLSY